MGILCERLEGRLVVGVLREPRERVWGRLLALEGPGLLLRGLELGPWEEILNLVRRGEGEQVGLSTRFVPMHRVEQLYLDEASRFVPSLAQDFLQRTGQDAEAFLGEFRGTFHDAVPGEHP